jgi:hypothetical protein
MSISIHSPRAAREHMRSRGSDRQSDGKNFIHGCVVMFRSPVESGNGPPSYDGILPGEIDHPLEFSVQNGNP